MRWVADANKTDGDRPMNDDALREKAREAIRAGKLPNRRPIRSWGGPGAGARCTICGALVTLDELELEIEFARDGDAGRDEHHVHVPCFTAWETEVQKLEGPAAAPSASGKQQSTHFAARSGPPVSISTLSLGVLPERVGDGKILNREYLPADKRRST
jgi:hypothetical protein